MTTRPPKERIGRRPPQALSDGPCAGPPEVVASIVGAPPLVRIAAPLARRFQQICAAMVAEALVGEDLVQLEYGTLVAIELDPGTDQRRLAEAMGIDRNHVSLIVERLHGLGLVDRRVKPDDRRADALYLTARGRALWKRIRARTQAANDRILAPLLKAEREHFIDLLIRLIDGNRAYARPGAGRRKRGTVKPTSEQE